MVALDALLPQRRVTRARERLGRGRPPLSASLARLRRHFDDELLARTGNSYRLTPLATQLRELVRVALSGAERVFTARTGFDPASSTREFSLLVSDYVVVVLGDVLVRLLGEEAPHARLRFGIHTPEMVDRAEQVLLTHDLLLMPHGFLTDLRHRDLYRDAWVCLVAAESPLVGTGLTEHDLRTLPWVLTYHGPTASTPATRQLRMLGVEPQVQVVTENFLTVPGLVAGSERIGLLQQRLVQLLPPASRGRPPPLAVLLGAMVGG